jgi:hypothetical protein
MEIQTDVGDATGFLLAMHATGIAKEQHLAPRGSCALAPITPAQRYRFQLPHLEHCTCHPTLVRLSGHLSIPALQLAVDGLVRRHQALRTRFPVVAGEIRQEVNVAEDQCFSTIDLTTVAMEHRWSEATCIVDRLARESIDPAEDPMFVVTLFELGETEHILLVLLHDCLTDAASDIVLWRDLWSLYVRALSSSSVKLPRIPIQFADFAVWLHHSEESWNEHHGGYWRERLAGARHVRLFEPHQCSPDGTSRCMRIFNFPFDARLTEGLRALSRRQETSLGMIVLTAWVALILRWTGESDLVVGFLSSGRVHSRLDDTIGCFMAPLYLRIELGADDSFLDLLKHVATEYSAAYEHHDFGRVLADAPGSGFRANTVLNWFPLEMLLDPASLLRQADPSRVAGDLRVLPLQYEPPQREAVDWDGEPVFSVSESREEMLVKVLYRADRIGDHQLQTLAEGFRNFAQSMQLNPATRIVGLPLVRC